MTHTRHILGIVGKLLRVPRIAEYVPSMRLDAGITGQTHRPETDRSGREGARPHGGNQREAAVRSDNDTPISGSMKHGHRPGKFGDQYLDKTTNLPFAAPRLHFRR